MSTTSIRAWDLPTRLFHWTLGGLFVGAFAVAHLADEHRPTFAIHMLLGLILLAAIAFRLVWGLVGSRHARFASFLHSPAALAGYLKDVVAGRDRPTVGHNPGASWAIYGMLLLPLALVTTGILAQPKRELFEDLHGALGWVMVAAVVFVALMAGWAALVLRGHDPVARVVRIAGTGLTIPVAEKPPRAERHGERRQGGQRHGGHQHGGHDDD